MENAQIDWQEVKLLYPIGRQIVCTVEQHMRFGVFVDIGHSVIKGLIEIIEFVDDGIMDYKQYPEIGAKIRAVILDYTPHNNQIRLSTKPSLLKTSVSPI